MGPQTGSEERGRLEGDSLEQLHWCHDVVRGSALKHRGFSRDGELAARLCMTAV